MTLAINDLNVPYRLLLGPGPSAVHPRVLRTMSTALVGYLDPEWLSLMDEEQALLRDVFQTKNTLTFPISGTGSAGMETAFCNFVEPGDTVVIGCNGYFSERMCEMARLYGADVKRIEKSWGDVFTQEEVEAALAANKPVKLFALIHAETSTGALQPLEGMGEIAHRHGALLLVDCVTSLSGAPLKIDEWGIDLAFSASQKCLGCPPGLSPFTAGDKAVEILHRRKNRVPNWYLDLTLLEKYWNKERVYHHTPSTTLHYGLREGLRLVLEEGLEDRWVRHRAIAEYLWEKMEALGLKLFIRREHRLPSLTTVCVPDGADDAAVRTRLREAYNIDIAGGFGPLKGKIWRVGLMGFSSRRENVTLLSEALREILDGRK
ncbi:MAG: alanine--glyoxylate aminotransferase [Deltaproteobacteria bacterium RBG_16_58_17]|nr:MAG: alanine--glyoxylate aminotransferase [Deltaproteobacteria bacterium RBG_16_58_17]